MNNESQFHVGQIVIHRPDAGWPVRSKNRTCVVLARGADVNTYQIRPLRGAGMEFEFTCLGEVLEAHPDYRERDGFDRIVARACAKLDKLKEEINAMCTDAKARLGCSTHGYTRVGLEYGANRVTPTWIEQVY